jgi:mannosyltransferase OCH1-like enzyme
MKLYRRYKPVIPLHVYVTWKTKKMSPSMQYNLDTLKLKNPEFTFHLYDDSDCREFIKKHFNKDTVNAFDTLIPGAYKADLWRLCILYIMGGYYMDIKLQTLRKFRLIELSEGEHFVLDRPRDSLHIYNAFMICKAGNPFLLKCIQNLVQNVKSRYYGSSYLSPTGPELLGRVAIKYGFKLPIDLIYPLRFNEHIMYNNTLIIRNYVGYRNEQKKDDYYINLWNNRNVYAVETI